MRNVFVQIISVILTTLLIECVVFPVYAASPPENSPIALGKHPRLFFTVDDLPALRERITKYYRNEFQDFINLLNNVSTLSAQQKRIENYWGGLNYAFVAVLDPQEMQRRGFIFSKGFNTPQVYCDKAINYVKNFLENISSAMKQGPHNLSIGYPENYYFSALVTYDWCYSYINLVDRIKIIDAFISAYNVKYKDKNLLNMEIDSRNMLCNNQSSANLHDILGIIAFYKDPYPDSNIQKSMYEAFHNIWIQRVLVELDYFYKNGTGWHEGPGNYLTDGYLNLGIPIAMYASALGIDYISLMPFFSSYPLFVLANLKPHGLLSQCGSSGTVPCRIFMERWGTIGGGIDTLSCKVSLLNSGMLRQSNHPNASLGKWLHINIGKCTDTVTRYGGTWSNAVLYWFLYGDREIIAQSPTQMNIAKTHKFGLGQYIFRSGYDSDASQVVFWAKEHRMYGHESEEYGSFTLHKFGNLILTPGNSKSGEGVLNGGTKSNLFQNILGVHKGISDPLLKFDGKNVDPLFGSRKISSIKISGKLIVEDINNPYYDYISYDNSFSWDIKTSNVSQREFIYVRGPINKEYIVVFDRMNVINPSTDKKIWKIWVPAQPEFVNGTPISSRIGQWTSTDTDTISMTNKRSFSDTSPRFESPPTHGKFYLKALAPDTIRVNVLGGPGKEFQSGDDDGSTPWGAPTITDRVREYLGWGRIEIRPTIAQNYDTFLNVIQFGDANSLSSMSPTAKVTTTNAKMIGVDIQDSANHWLVLFAKHPSDLSEIISTGYTFRPIASLSKHLVVNMKPSTTFYMTHEKGMAGTTVVISSSPRTGSVVLTSTKYGVVHFTLDNVSNNKDDMLPVRSPNLPLSRSLRGTEHIVSPQQ
jgi:hypothetical protein